MPRFALLGSLLWLLSPGQLHGQVVCAVPDAIREGVEGSPPLEEWYETRWVTGAEGSEVPLGVGHLRYSDRNPWVARPPGEDDWLRRMELPLSPVPGEEATAWIVGGWVIREDADPVALLRSEQVETGYEEPSLLVLETVQGWLHVRFGDEAGDSGWVQVCALDGGPVVLDYAPWAEWLVSDAISPLFFRADAPDDLFASPAGDAAHTPIAGDHHLEPIEIRGPWMRVRVKEPSDYCDFDVEVEAREGWVRWYDAETGPRVWYFTRGC